MNESQYDDLVGKIYDAAVMPEVWPVFLEQLSEALDSKGTALYLADFARRSSTTCSSDDIPFVQSVRIDPEKGASYDRYYSSVNVWFEHSSDLAEGRLITTDRLFSDRELIKTEWYNDWLRPQGYFHAMIGHLLKQDNWAVRLSIFRAKQQPFSADETALFARLVPHLQRSCRIHKTLCEAQAAQAADVALLNRLPVGVVLFDSAGQALSANRMAETLSCSSDGGFRLNAAGRCVAADRNQSRDLRQLLDRAVESGQSGAMSLRRHGSDRPLTAVAVALQYRPSAFSGSAPAAALLLCDPDIAPNLDDKLLTQCYGLSPAEARLAAALLGGQTPSDYAQNRGISDNTVKTQLKQVLAKTGTHRQSELVQLLNTGFGMLAESS
jgi:DNA-binding CsgD family transcriptional regulator